MRRDRPRGRASSAALVSYSRQSEGGHAHLAVLEDWIRRPIEGIEGSQTTSNSIMTYPGLLPGWIEGRYGHFPIAPFLILLNRLLDWLDGAIARISAE